MPDDERCQHEDLLPWLSEPHRLWSVLAVYQDSAEKFLQGQEIVDIILKVLDRMVLERVSFSHVLSLDERAVLKSQLAQGEPFYREMGAIATADRSRRVLHHLDEELLLRDAYNLIGAIRETFFDEVSRWHILFLDERETGLYNGGACGVFGQTVTDSFPSVADDLDESTKCLALGRSTACVFHLMRAIECASSAMAQSLGLDVANLNPQNKGIGRYLRYVTDCIDGKQSVPTAQAHWPCSKPFYEDAMPDLQAVKRAWRNPAMHMEKTYTLGRAKEIMDATKAFMGQIASHITEAGTYLP